MATVRKSAGLVAALLLIALATAFLQGPTLPFAAVLLAVGIAAAVWQARTLWATRTDKYDLRRLYDAPYPGEDEPEEFEQEPGVIDVPICHRCGHAVAASFARCPECGTQVR